ncbi:MAG: hypothetical protein UDG86_02280 [Lachnospiraceae bacterium]|jgi:hypothetical protein|nr:hypothetical protein [Lachnospiraceae bacterium]
MSEEPYVKMTAIDQISGGSLQIIKAALPYIEQPGQRMLAVYIKAMELSNILSFYQETSDMSACSLEPEHASFQEMLQDIRNFCTQAEQEMIDQCINIFQMINLYSSFQNSGSSSDMMKNLLSPEQQSLFETYQSMFTSA